MVGEPITPQSIGPGELDGRHQARRSSPARPQGLLFHGGPNDKYTPDTLAELALKYEHLRQEFLMLCSRPVRYFVLCSSQNNLVVDHPTLR